MYPYQDPNQPIEARIDDLLARMTTEEKIAQTDQYGSSDFTTVDENGRATSVDFDRLDELLGKRSVGSVQLRGMTAAQANAVQRYAVEQTRLGIPFLFSEEALHGFYTGRATSFPNRSAWPQALSLRLATRWAAPSRRRHAPAVFTKHTALLWT